MVRGASRRRRPAGQRRRRGLAAGAGPTIFAPLSEDTRYFGRPEQQWMLNFRVSDLDTMLAQLRAAGAAVEDEVVSERGVGRFGYATDPEGNRFELWEPSSP